MALCRSPRLLERLFYVGKPSNHLFNCDSSTRSFFRSSLWLVLFVVFAQALTDGDPMLPLVSAIVLGLCAFYSVLHIHCHSSHRQKYIIPAQRHPCERWPKVHESCQIHNATS